MILPKRITYKEKMIMCKNNVKWNQAEFKSTCIILQIIHTFCQIGEHVVLFVSHVNLAFCRVTCTASRTSDPPTCSCDCLVVMQGLRLLTAAHQVTVQSHYPPTVGRTVQKAPESTLLLKFVFERLLNLFFWLILCELPDYRGDAGRF